MKQSRIRRTFPQEGMPEDNEEARVGSSSEPLGLSLGALYRINLLRRKQTIFVGPLPLEETVLKEFPILKEIL